jgi:GAF domain-containing protein
LDVQSLEPEAFSEEDVAVLQALADQVAVAINNARLFQQAQESLEAERRAYGELSREGWRQLLQVRPHLSLVKDERGISAAPEIQQPEVEKALETGEAIASQDGDENLVVPIQVRGQTVGAIDAYSGEAWSPDRIRLLERLAEQLGDALDDARMYEDAQRRAAREAVIGDVTARMRETLDMDSVLRTAAREMQSILDLAEVEVRLGPSPQEVSPTHQAGAADEEEALNEGQPGTGMSA